MNNKEFISKLQNVVDNHKTVYMWGVFGAPVTETLIASKTRQYPKWYTAVKQAKFRKLVGQGYFGFDCVNVIKGILWGWNGDATKSHGGAAYVSNGVPDIGADKMITRCIGVSNDFSTIIPGEAVWLTGHIGIYIGNGKVIECTPIWRDGVQITACLNRKAIAGMHGRRWTKHGKLPYVIYEEDKPVKQPTTQSIKVGKVNARLGLNVRKGPGTGHAKVTALAYNAEVKIYGESRGWYNVGAGWVSAKYVTIGTTASTTPTTPQRVYVVQKGDSLWKIAGKVYKNPLKWGELKRLNGLKSNTINVGQKLKY